jgi:hypothetical protein
MKATKFVVLVAGLLGIIGFFLPIVKADTAEWSGSYTGFQAMKGIDEASDIITLKDKALDDQVREMEDSAFGKAQLESFAKKADDLRIVITLIFGPAFVIAIIAGIAIGMKKFGRLPAVGTLVMALMMTLLGLALLGAGDETTKVGPAVYLVFAGGVVGVVGSVMTLVKPDEGGRFA